MIMAAEDGYHKSRGRVRDVTAGTAVLTWFLDTFLPTFDRADYLFIDLETQSTCEIIRRCIDSIVMLAKLRHAIIKHRSRTGQSDVIPWSVTIPSATRNPQTMVLLHTLPVASAKPGSWHQLDISYLILTVALNALTRRGIIWHISHSHPTSPRLPFDFCSMFPRTP